MDGRIRAGWYREAEYGPDHVLRVRRAADAWLATLWSRGAGRPCAAGCVLSRAEWRRLLPAEAIRSVDDEDASERDC